MRNSAVIERLRTLAAEDSDPARLSRGKQYFRSGHVESIEVSPRRIIGWVMGSQREPYVATIACRPLDDAAESALQTLLDAGVSLGAAMEALTDSGVAIVPESVAATCTCRDWESPCKHAVAVMLAFAHMVTDAPEPLARWRGFETNAPAASSGALLDDMKRRNVVVPARTLVVVPDEPLHPFFVGGVPPDLDVVADDVRLTPLAVPFSTLVYETIDIGAVLVDVMDELRQSFG